MTDLRKDGEISSREFAEKLYDLDRLVYELSGSSLGRVFTEDRERNVIIIEKALNARHEHILRSELALIGNMARTIKDKDKHFQALSAYNETFSLFERIATDPGRLIVNDQAMNLNELNLHNRFTRENRLIICINRSYGSAANNIGLGIADRLHIDYYDAEVFMRIHQRTEYADGKPHYTRAETDVINSQLEAGNPGLSYQREKISIKERIDRTNRYHGLPLRDAYFFEESDYILNMAREKDFVIMGRCADLIMQSNHIPHVSIYITAPESMRIKRIMDLNNVSEREARRHMHAVDSARAKYYEFFTNRKWSDASNYDITLNTSSFGVQGSIDFILQLLDNAGLGGNR